MGATGRDRDSYFLQLARYIVFNPVALPLSNTPVYGVEQLWLDDRRNHVAEYTGLRARIFCTNLLLRKITTLSTEL